MRTFKNQVVSGNYKIIRRYKDMGDFDRARIHASQNPGGNDLFWSYATPFALNDMRDHMGKMGRKFNQKLAENIGTEVQVGILSNKCVVTISPGRQGSSTYTYVFFGSANEEVQAELNNTFLL